MLKEDLLLDSTRPFSDTPDIDLGGPESDSMGVLSSWYVLRVSYSRELKIQDRLKELGVKSFVPMMWKKVKGEKKLVPAVSNLCFAYWTREALDGFIRSYGETSPVSYYWDRTVNRPMTVPKKAMDDFMLVASSMDEDLIYITEISGKLKEGQTVKVKDGPFKGVEGKIVRIRKSRRILVELPGMLAVASTYIAPQFLEII